MKILALDLGTLTGVAWTNGPETTSRTWTLATETDMRYARKLRMDRRLDPRAIRLYTKLVDAFQIGAGVDYVVFEDVRFGKSLAQVQLWSSFRGVVWATACRFGVEVECLETGKLKKFATGSGSADKDFMGAALVAKHPGVYWLENRLVRRVSDGTLLDDNAVDALHLLDWAKQTLNK